tara:strand:- start:56 stop:781 length:726 start_codon:yes stop_codon:yes gene_type:complete
MDSKIKVYDDFLSEKDLNFILDSLVGPFSEKFPWAYSGRIVPIENCICDDLDDYQFVHTFYWGNKPQSDHYDLIDPLIKKIPNLASLVKVKANLNPRHPKVFTHGFHIDMNFKCTTGIYYLNTNNGYTEFEDGTKIESVRNRFISFPSDINHTGSTCNDKRMRLLINFNYFQGEPVERGSYNTGDGYFSRGDVSKYERESSDELIEQGEGLPPDVSMEDIQNILSYHASGIKKREIMSNGI